MPYIIYIYVLTVMFPTPAVITSLTFSLKTPLQNNTLPLINTICLTCLAKLCLEEMYLSKETSAKMFCQQLVINRPMFRDVLVFYGVCSYKLYRKSNMSLQKFLLGNQSLPSRVNNIADFQFLMHSYIHLIWKKTSQPLFCLELGFHNT